MDEPSEDADRTRRAELVLALRTRGVRQTRTLKAMETIPRSAFVPARHRGLAYADRSLPIACGQTIESPSDIATMIDALAVGDLDTVLEVGTGSGYATAILSRLARRVTSVDRWRTLAEGATRRLSELGGVSNVTVLFGDGVEGRPQQAPFERILIAAAVKSPPSALINQLKAGGVMVAAIGDDGGQRITRFVKAKDGSLDETTIGAARLQPIMSGTAIAL